MPKSEAQKKATAKYRAKAYDTIELRLHKGDREIIKGYATHNGKSVNALITELLQREIPDLRH